MTLGENIIFYRRQKGITQEQLADIMQVSRQSVSKWENNETVPELQKLIKLADELEVDLDELCGRQSRSSEPTVELKSNEVPKESILRKVIAVALVLVLLLVVAMGGYYIGQKNAISEQTKESYINAGIADVSITGVDGTTFICTFTPEVYVEDFEYTIVVSKRHYHDEYEVETTFENGVGKAEIIFKKEFEYDLKLKVKYKDVVRSILMVENLEVNEYGGCSYTKCN